MTVSAPLAHGTFPGDTLDCGFRQRPVLELQHVLDACLALAHSSGGPVAIFSESHWFVDELRDRFDEAGILGHFLPSSATLTQGALDELAAPLQLAIWAAKGQPEMYRSMVRAVAPGGRICHLAAGAAYRRLDEALRLNARSQLLDDSTSCSWLRLAGVDVVSRYGLRGPMSLAWGALAGASDRIGWDELSDFAHRRMRASFLETGPLVRWSVLTLTIGHLPSRSVQGQ